MKFRINLKGKDLLHNWLFWLILITGIAIIIRSIPAWINAAWGCDFGIYFGLTKSVATQGELFPEYIGWGSSYNYFPVLYAINTFAHWITGIDILVLMPKLTPIFGGLTVFIFYFLINELLNNKKIALLSTAILAVIPFHVYQLSHASPLTIGHFFMILSLYLFFKYRKNSIYIFPLLISTVLLIMSHHLTTYFYLITLIMIVFFENSSQKLWIKTLNKDIFYILLSSASVFIYWIFIATPVFESFMNNGFKIAGVKIGSSVVILLYFVLFFISLTLSKLVWKFGEKLKKKNLENPDSGLHKSLLKIDVFLKKKEPTIRSRKIIFFTFLIIFISAMVLFIYIPLPWTDFPFTWASLFYSIPLLLVFAFTAVGFRYTSNIKNGFLIRGWLFAIILSFIYAISVQSTALLPHRHFEYLMYPVSIISVFGIGAIFSDPYLKTLITKVSNKKDLIIKYKGLNKIITYKTRVSFFVFFIMLILVLAGSVYTSHNALNQSWEEISSEDISAIEWIGANLDKNNSLIVSDHRLERLAEAEGFNTSNDEVINLWYKENISDFIDELLSSGKGNSSITHILIDDVMKNKGVHIGPKNSSFRTIFMSNETWTGGYDKFLKQPFELIQRFESESKDPITNGSYRWAEIYEVNWTYLQKM